MKHVFSEEIFEPGFELEGPHLVAASAGTGKTYTAVAMAVRQGIPSMTARRRSLTESRAGRRPFADVEMM